jgi:hypothetical protein
MDALEEKMTGEDLRGLLDKHPHAAPLKEDNNAYLVSYKFDTGAEIAFDPRTKTKCSVFIEKLPARMQGKFPHIESYPPTQPSTALKRVSSALSDAPTLCKVDLPNAEVASELLAWVRWA